MTTYKYTLNAERLIPKPRGAIGKQGHMTHSMYGYRDWQASIINSLSSNGFKWLPNAYYLYDIEISSKRGRPPDLSNLIGSWEDVLVKAGYIQDDNWKFINRFYTQGRFVQSLGVNPRLNFYQTDNLEMYCKLLVQSITGRQVEIIFKTP